MPPNSIPWVLTLVLTNIGTVKTDVRERTRVIYVAEKTIDGKPSLIVAGINVTENIVAGAVDPHLISHGETGSCFDGSRESKRVVERIIDCARK